MFELLPIAALTIEFSEEEILADLLYPSAPAQREPTRGHRPPRRPGEALPQGR